MAHLIVVEGPNSGKIYPLEEKNTLGSVQDDAIALNDRRFDCCYLSIERYSRGYVLSTLVPEKKVKVNGERIKKAYLHHGDIITIAGTMLLYFEEKEEFGDLARSAVFPVADSDEYPSVILPSRGILSEEVSSPKSEILQCITPHDYRAGILKSSSRETGRRLRVLVDINTAISEIQDLQLLLNRILSIIVKEFTADRGLIILLRPDRKFEVKAFFQGNRDTSPLKYTRKITRRVLMKRTSLIYNASLQKIGESFPLSCMSVPLTCKGKLLGLIQIENFSGYKYVRDDVDQLCKVAVQTGIAVENLLTYQQPIQYRQHLISLEKFSQALSRHLERNKIFKEAANAAQSLFSSERISILLVNDGGDLELAYSTVIPQEEWKKGTLPTNHTLAGKVFLKNKPLLISDSKEIPEGWRYPHRQKIAYRSLSAILAPIQVTSYHGVIKKKLSA